MAKKAKGQHGGLREGAGRKVSGVDNVAVKVDRQIVADAKENAAWRKSTLAAYLNKILGPQVRRDKERNGRQ